jgi:hypothetical protein
MARLRNLPSSQRRASSIFLPVRFDNLSGTMKAIGLLFFLNGSFDLGFF